MAEGGDKGWDGWMASPTQWTWVWANSRRCEGQGSLVCRSTWDCRVGNNLATHQWNMYLGFPGGSVVNLPATQETWVRSLAQEDPLEKGTETQGFLPGESHGQGSLVGYSPEGHRATHDWATNTFTFRHRWECKMVQLLRKTVCKFPKLLIAAVIQQFHSWVYMQEELKHYVHIKTYTWIFIAKLFVVAKIHQLMNGQIWRIYAMDYYSAIIRHEILIHTLWVNARLESQAQKTTYYMNPLIRNVQNMQIYRDRKMSACLAGTGRRVGGREVWLLIRFLLEWWNVLKLILRKVAQLCKYMKNHWITHLKWANYKVCDVHLHKTVFKN